MFTKSNSTPNPDTTDGMLGSTGNLNEPLLSHSGDESDDSSQEMFDPIQDNTPPLVEENDLEGMLVQIQENTFPLVDGEDPFLYLRIAKTICFSFISLRGFFTISTLSIPGSTIYLGVISALIGRDYYTSLNSDLEYLRGSRIDTLPNLPKRDCFWAIKYGFSLNVMVLAAFGACVFDTKHSLLVGSAFSSPVVRWGYFASDCLISGVSSFFLEAYDDMRWDVKKQALSNFIEHKGDAGFSGEKIKRLVKEALLSEYIPSIKEVTIGLIIIEFVVKLSILFTDTLGGVSVLGLDPYVSLVLILPIGVLFLALSSYSLWSELPEDNANNYVVGDPEVISTALGLNADSEASCCSQVGLWFSSKFSLSGFIFSLQALDAIVSAYTDQESLEAITGFSEEQRHYFMLTLIVVVPTLNFFGGERCRRKKQDWFIRQLLDEHYDNIFGGDIEEGNSVLSDIESDNESKDDGSGDEEEKGSSDDSVISPMHQLDNGEGKVEGRASSSQGIFPSMLNQLRSRANSLDSFLPTVNPIDSSQDSGKEEDENSTMTVPLPIGGQFLRRNSACF